MINDHKDTTKINNLVEWEIQLCMYINFISSKDTGKTLFQRKSFLDNYQKEEQIMRGGSNFVFESVELLNYNLHKISLKRGKSYIKSREWLENK